MQAVAAVDTQQPQVQVVLGAVELEALAQTLLHKELMALAVEVVEAGFLAHQTVMEEKAAPVS